MSRKHSVPSMDRVFFIYHKKYHTIYRKALLQPPAVTELTEKYNELKKYGNGF